jgi:cysteine desulfurase
MERLGFAIVRVPVESSGIVSPEAVERAVVPGTVLVSVMHANNEIGTIQPIADIARVAHAGGALFHTDAVQTVGHVPIDVDAMDIDLLSLSGHKFYGPKGVGALVIRKATPFTPLLHGGGQEKGRRSSTHNVPGIVGLGKALELAAAEMDTERARVAGLRDRLLRAVLDNVRDVRLNGDPVQRLDNNIHLSIRGVEGESLVMHLDLEGVAASSGSACSAGSASASHVLTALGLPPEETRGSLRLTLGRFTTSSDCDMAAGALIRVVERLRRLSSFGSST